MRGRGGKRAERRYGGGPGKEWTKVWLGRPGLEYSVSDPPVEQKPLYFLP